MTSDICLATDGFAAFSSRDVRFCPFRATSQYTHKPRVSLRSALGYALVALSGRAGNKDVGVSDTVGRLPNALSGRNGNNVVGVRSAQNHAPYTHYGTMENHSHPDQ